jgi:hypothetical protein
METLAGSRKGVRDQEKVSGTNGTGISGGNQDVVDLVGETRNP